MTSYVFSHSSLNISSIRSRPILRGGKFLHSEFEVSRLIIVTKLENRNLNVLKKLSNFKEKTNDFSALWIARTIYDSHFFD